MQKLPAVELGAGRRRLRLLLLHHRSFLSDLLQQLLHRRLELAIATRQVILRRVLDRDVWLHAVILHVGPLRIGQIDAHAGRAHCRTIYQRVTARADDRAHRRRANSLAQAQGLEAGGEHLGVRGRAPVLQDRLWAEETGEGAARRLGPARLPDLVLALDQDGEQLLFYVAAAVPSLIDDERLFVAVLADLFLELAKAGL